MKPMLIIPPAPAHWPALRDLLQHEGSPWIADLERRLVHGVKGAQDAYAVMPSGGQSLASACVNKYGDLGVLGHCFTRPEHRRHGYARKLVEAVVSWFEMTGGKWLFLGTTAELDESLYRKFGFTALRRAVWAPYDRLTMCRAAPDTGDGPLAGCSGGGTVRDLTRAEWPAMVTLLQYRPGPDPRVPLDESAVIAEVFTLDLVEHQERGACGLMGVFEGERLVGLATVATDRGGERTYAMLIPHTDAPPELRAAALEFAHRKGYSQVDFPMEGLGPSHGGDPARPEAGHTGESTPRHEVPPVA